MIDVLLATSADLPDGEPGGHLLVEAFETRGVAARWACWDDRSVDWSEARLVAVRSTWDYDGRSAEFLAWAEHVERWSTLLHGSSVFRWNLDKGYLLALQDAGVPVVPTALLDDPEGIAEAAARFTGRTLVKPRVAAGGRGLVVLEAGPDLGLDVSLEAEQGPWIVQPVVESVRTEGETSVFVLGGVPVAQAVKVPAGDEVRVHEKYGGSTRAVPLSDEAMLLGAETVAAAQELLGAELTYARVDLMRLETGQLVVSELEVVEPGLYLEVLPANADAFADVVAALLGRPEN